MTKYAAINDSTSSSEHNNNRMADARAPLLLPDAEVENDELSGGKNAEEGTASYFSCVVRARTGVMVCHHAVRTLWVDSGHALTWFEERNMVDFIIHP